MALIQMMKRGATSAIIASYWNNTDSLEGLVESHLMYFNKENNEQKITPLLVFFVKVEVLIL